MVLSDVYSVQKYYPHPNFDSIHLAVSSYPSSSSIPFLNKEISTYVENLFCTEKNLLVQPSHRQLILYLYLLERNLSANNLAKTQLALISEIAESPSEIGLLLACNFLQPRLDTIDGGAYEYDSNTWERVVNCWIEVSKLTIQMKSSLYRKIKVRLCSMMTECLREKRLGTAILYTLLLKHPHDLLIDLCLDFSIEDSSWVAIETEFLGFLIDSDVSAFTHEILVRFEKMEGRFSKAWICSYLDNFLTDKLPKLRLSGKNYFLAIITPLVANRATKMLSTLEASHIDQMSSLTNLTCAIIDAINDYAERFGKLEDALVGALSIFTHRPPYKSTGLKSLCYLGVCIVTKHTGNKEPVDSTGQKLYKELVELLFAVLPLLLKGSDSPSQGLSGETVVTWLIDLLETSNDSDTSLTLKTMNPALIEKVCRACLKYGISVEAHRGGCPPFLLLYLVRLLLQLRQSLDTATKLSETLNSKDIFDKITSHSKFKQLFTEELSTDNDNDSVRYKIKLAVVNLLITCVSNTADIIFERYVWKILLGSFNAGLGELDKCLHKLVLICPEEYRPFLDELRWDGLNDLATDDDESPEKRWDWFLSALDSGRIRATISNFPTDDTISSVLQTDKSNIDEDIQMHNDGVNPRKVPHKVHRTDKDDFRYSPSFILPLMLGALESFACYKRIRIEIAAGDSEAIDKKKESNDKMGSNQITIAAMHRLCDKGCISLCLASLSSSCETVRCYAAAILGIALQVCSSAAARDVTSWRDRPQLLMVLNSVQRSLVLQKVNQSVPCDVPRLLPIVSCFLARAALVVSRPDDALYVPMNRYFLKTESDHGAFQDTNRLPAFVSLFCSTSDNLDQSRAERIWALQMVRDGLADPSCYRLVAACHAPELIMTNFENVILLRTSVESRGTEYCLLLDCLKAMIDHGGYGAQTHLIRRCGLLSWMRTLYSTHPIHEFFPTSSNRTSFCNLVRSTVLVLSGTSQLRTNLAVSEVCGLIEPLLSMCLPTDGSQKLEMVTEYAFLTLGDIQMLLSLMKQDGMTCSGIKPLGGSLKTSLQVLQYMETSQQESALAIMCSLPVLLTADLPLQVIDDFIGLSLECCKRHDSSATQNHDNLCMLVLKRIFILLEYNKAIFGVGTKDGNILRNLFMLRSQLDFSKDDSTSRDMWLQCLQSIATTKKQHDDHNVHDEFLDFVSKNLR